MLFVCVNRAGNCGVIETKMEFDCNNYDILLAQGFVFHIVNANTLPVQNFWIRMLESVKVTSESLVCDNLCVIWRSMLSKCTAAQ